MQLKQFLKSSVLSPLESSNIKGGLANIIIVSISSPVVIVITITND